jgi:hypothetical protein
MLMAQLAEKGEDFFLGLQEVFRGELKFEGLIFLGFIGISVLSFDMNSQ